MNLDFTEAEQAFQREVRQWLEANAPKGPQGAGNYTREAVMAWEQKLAKAGYAVPGWPKEYGGPGWTATQRHIWNMERVRANAPGDSVFGSSMAGPAIMAFGSPELKAEHLPHIANGTRLWCQGYSEPGAGSDLASLKTQAVRDGDHYVVNGQKIWTTGAHLADWCFCLVRTSTEGRKQEGITFLLIDMKTPGIEVRPIVSIDGHHHLNEVFFKDVRVPVRNVVGQENQGWTVAKYLLLHERTTIAFVPEKQRELADLKRLLATDPALRQSRSAARDVAALEVDLIALEFTNLRALEGVNKGRPPGPEASCLKLKGSELAQDIAELKVRFGAYASLPWHTEPVGDPSYAQAAERYNFERAGTIYGGTSEVQKTLIAKFALGL